MESVKLTYYISPYLISSYSFSSYSKLLVCYLGVKSKHKTFIELNSFIYLESHKTVELTKQWSSQRTNHCDVDILVLKLISSA